MIAEHLTITLASKSPRRQQLLEAMGVHFTVKVKEVEEVFPEDLPCEEVALYLARLKASAFDNDRQEGEVTITADTTVCLNGRILNKPANREEAIKMLRSLSGNQHTVVTGVCLKSNTKTTEFSSATKVYFKPLTTVEIEHYVDTYQPFDKAGSYGIQEWIGYIGIEKIEGCYFNVVGLPLNKVYDALLQF